MKNKNKDFVLYAKASVFPVGHENHGKRLLMERGSVAFLEAKCAMARIKPSKVGITKLFPRGKAFSSFPATYSGETVLTFSS